ncbi:MAG TPA: hypothetical protein VNO82_15090, partial [Solirubrobacteraceae bacterium]|nr:hypothetical protein [Solirubrobacteraceae bacterium]
MHRSTARARAAALIATLALAAGATACGDDDNDGDSNGAGAGTASQASNDGGGAPAGGERTGREAEVEDTLTSIQAEFVKGQGTAYCDRLTKAGQRQVVTFAKAFAI